MSVLDNILTGRHARIHTHPLAEMLFLPSVRREEIRHRAAVERIIEAVETLVRMHTAQEEDIYEAVAAR